MTRPEPNVQLREARMRLGMTREALAAQLGISAYTIGRWERGEAEPGPELLPKVCAILEMKVADLGFGPPQAHSEPLIQPVYDPTIPLPSQVPLVGRERELAQLRQRLTDTQNITLSIINGLPGIGKTTLAITLAHDKEIRQHFRDGILWAGLGPEPNIAAHLGRWGQLLSIGERQAAGLNNVEEWAQALRSAIGERTMLLVIDDAWSVEAALALKVGGPNCVHLVTTRIPAIAARLSIDEAFLLRELDDTHSIELLYSLAPRVVAREGQKTQQLVQAVGGLPLALTLMGNYLRKQGYTGLNRRINAALERLHDARERLAISEPVSPGAIYPSLADGAPLSLQSIIAVTDQQLDEATSQALYMLAIFPPKPASFSEAAALAVTRCPIDTLDVLVDTGLLESNNAERYTLHQTIADYARLHLSQAQAMQAAERLAAFMLDYVEAHAQDYERLDRESSAMIAALEASYTVQNYELFQRLVMACTPFMLLRSWYTQADLYLQRANEAARAQQDTSAIIDTLQRLGELAHNLGEFMLADTRLEEGLALARQLHDKQRISALLADRGQIAWKRGDYAQAESFLLEGLPLAQELNDRKHLSEILRALGALLNSQGKYKQAEQYLLEGLALARQVGDQETILTLLNNLGVSAGEQGNYAQSEGYFHEMLAIARKIGHREAICASLSNLGETSSDQGNYKQAEEYLLEGLALARQINHREWTSGLLINLGTMLRKQGKLAQAETYLLEGLALARQVNRLQMLIMALYECGCLQLDFQRIGEAKKFFNDMLSAIPKGDRDSDALAHYGLARIAALEDNRQEALKLGQYSADMLKATNNRKYHEVENWMETLQET